MAHTITSFRDFKRKIQPKEENEQKRKPIALCARLGGSTVDFVVTGLNSETPQHFVFDLKKISKTHAIDTLYEVISFVSFQAERLAQKVLPITFGIAGAATKAHHELFEKDGKTLPQNKKGLHILPNTEFESERVEGVDHPQAKSLINFMDDLIKALEKRGLLEDVNYQLKYKDEDDTLKPHTERDDLMQINFTVINDTLAIANSIIKKLKSGDNVLSMVSGSGFNVGLSSNFNESNNSFDTTKNTEFGHVNLENTEKYEGLLSDLDKETFRNGKIESLTPDKLFSGGPSDRKLNHGVEAKIDYLQSLSGQERKQVLKSLTEEYYIDINEVLQSALLKEGSSHKPEDITQAYEQDDKLAKLLLTDLVTKLAKTLKIEYGDFIRDTNTKYFVITGSFFENLYKQEDLKEVFDKELNQDRNKNLKISFLDKDTMDGLKDLIKQQSNSIS